MMTAALLDRSRAVDDGGAVVDRTGTYTYADLSLAADRVAGALLARAGSTRDLASARVAFRADAGFAATAVIVGIWRAGGVAVPLALSHPPAELDYVIRDAETSLVVADEASAEVARPVADAAGAGWVEARAALEGPPAPGLEVDLDRRALILYTSGTTGRPKGVVTTHRNIASQVDTLVSAWGWSERDRALLVLPLHHVHGLINVVCSAMRVGATCEVPDAVDTETIWTRLASGEVTLFTAVPTTYHRLIAAWEAASPEERERHSHGAGSLRLMMSGSAALPVSVREQWRRITGHLLLERYGMTEIGMALSNPLHGDRLPGCVGSPLPGVAVRLVDAADAPVEDGVPGEIQVRGPGVFLEYWRRPEATTAAFCDGWFRTGDVATRADGVYRIFGRTSVDIIKTGGYKVSALEIEEVVRQFAAVRECAVVGVADEEWGQRVAVAVETVPGSSVTLDALISFVRPHLAPYKIPRLLRVVDALPRNAMGKVVKPDVAALFSPP